MMLHLFTSGADPDVYGFTADPTGANLPPQFKPWQSSGQALDVGAGDVLAGAGSADAIMNGVKQNGYYLARGGIKITKASMPQ